MNGEQKMWKWLHQRLKKYGHFERIESHGTAIGTPDVDYCINGYNNKIELKYTSSYRHGFKLRPAQCAWFKNRVKAGGQPWVLAQAELPGKSRGIVLVAGTDVPNLVHTTKVIDWLQAGVMVWKEQIDIVELINFLSFYLIPENVESKQEPEESSSLILLPKPMKIEH